MSPNLNEIRDGYIRDLTHMAEKHAQAWSRAAFRCEQVALRESMIVLDKDRRAFVQLNGAGGCRLDFTQPTPNFAGISLMDQENAQSAKAQLERMLPDTAPYTVCGIREYAEQRAHEVLECMRWTVKSLLNPTVWREVKASTGLVAALENAGCNTRMEYFYRGEDDVIKREVIIVAGVLNEREEQEFRSSLDDYDYFIPEQVGLPPLRPGLGTYGPGDDDPWHRIDLFSITAEPTNCPGTAKELLAKFRAAHWDPSHPDLQSESQAPGRDCEP
jgi:hypothetical protein